MVHLLLLQEGAKGVNSYQLTILRQKCRSASHELGLKGFPWPESCHLPFEDTTVERPRIVLTGIGPKLQGLRWESDSTLRIGRLDSLEIVLNDSSISRRHAEVVPTEDHWIVRDLGSMNGTMLNGKRLGRTDQQLKDNDVVQCGDMIFNVSFASNGVPRNSWPEQVLPANALEVTQPRIKTSGAFVKVQAATQRSWQQALEVVALDKDQKPRQGQELLTLLRTNHYLCHIASLDELLQSILDDVVSILRAQRGAIALANETGQLRLRALAMPNRTTPNGRSYSKTLAERCFSQEESLLCRDVNTDADLSTAHSVAGGAMSSIICVLLRSPRKKLGVLHLDRGPLQEPFSQEDFYLADAIAATAAVGIESALLVEGQRDQFVQTVTALARAVELRDNYTAGHTQRVTDYSVLLAEELNLTSTERQHIRVGTPLHDIGKIGIEDAILRKPAKLTPAEFERMKLHTVKGVVILESIPAMGPMIPIVRSHHERWDGTGYPDGLVKEQIPPGARIVAVADAFDAMTSERPYRPAMSVDQAYAELASKAGTHFDPACVQAFQRLRSKVEAIVSQEASVNQQVVEASPTVPRQELERLVHSLSKASKL